MPEIWFYHLMGQSFESALASLLERALERGWRAVVQTPDEERAQAIDDFLWVYSDETFLAHGRAADGDADLQPIWLTCGADNPNGAQIRVLIGRGDLGEAARAPYERVILLFDGRDDEQVAAARAQWRTLKENGAALSYWRQDDEGRWRKIDTDARPSA